MQLSNTAKATGDSFVRNILALTQKPGVISFAGGLPDPLLFPLTPISSTIKEILDEQSPNIFQYGPTAGYLPLREIIASQYNQKGYNTND